MNTQQRDDMLWRVAKKRAAFKITLVSYLIVNAFLIGIWFLTSGPYSHCWPIWSMLGWGVGLAFLYFSAYHNNNLISVEREYEKLKQQQELSNHQFNN